MRSIKEFLNFNEDNLTEQSEVRVIKAGAHSIKGKDGAALKSLMKRIARDIERARAKIKDRTGPILK